MRFMYLAYGVSPYGANGMDVVEQLHARRRAAAW